MITDRSIKKWTLQEYHRLGEAGLLQDGRYELLNGEIVEMSPVGIRHKACVRRLTKILPPRIGEAALLEVQQPLVVGSEEPVPDVVLLRPDPHDYDHRNPAATDTLLVIEIADATLRTDQEVKVPKYALHGVPEAWVVDLNSDRVWVYRHPKDGVYTSIQAHDRGITLNPELLPQVRLTTDEILGRPV
jgi:Uma2 family endonuclease